MKTPIKLRTKFAVLNSVVEGWSATPLAKFVWDEDIFLIGACFGECVSAVGACEVTVSKGISDFAADLSGDDVYFHLVGSFTEGAVTADVASGTDLQMIPYPFAFFIHEDEPVFADVFAAALGDGGTLLIYYATAKDFK